MKKLVLESYARWPMNSPGPSRLNMEPVEPAGELESGGRPVPSVADEDNVRAPADGEAVKEIRALVREYVAGNVFLRVVRKLSGDSSSQFLVKRFGVNRRIADMKAV